MKARSLQEYGDHALDRKALFDDNVALVKRIACHLCMGLPAAVQQDDMVQVGLIALYEASQNFVDLGSATFLTYATTRIRGAMIDELRRTSPVPRQLQQQQKRIAAAVNSIEQRSGRPAQEREVAEELGMPLDEYLGVLQDMAGSSLLCLDDVAEALEVSCGSEAQDDVLQREEMLRLLTELIENLPEREKMVVALYFQEELNLKEIGAVLEVSEARASQILSQGLGRMRSRLALRLNPLQRA